MRAGPSCIAALFAVLFHGVGVASAAPLQALPSVDALVLPDRLDDTVDEEKVGGRWKALRDAADRDMAAGRVPEAVSALKAAVAEAPAVADLYLRLARAYRLSGRGTTAALPLLDGLAARRVDLPEVHFERALVFAPKPQVAAEAWAAFVKNGGSKAGPERAAELIDEIAVTNPRAAESFAATLAEPLRAAVAVGAARVRAARAAGDPARAYELAREMTVARPNDADAAWWAGESAHRLRMFETAVRHFWVVAATDPARPHLFGMMAGDLIDLEPAVRDRLRDELRGAATNESLRATALFLDAVVDHYNKRHAAAITALERLVVRFPRSTRVRLYWAMSLLAAGRGDEAERTIAPLLENDPERDPDTWYCAARIVGRRDRAAAVAHFERFLAAEREMEWERYAPKVRRIERTTALMRLGVPLGPALYLGEYPQWVAAGGLAVAAAAGYLWRRRRESAAPAAARAR